MVNAHQTDAPIQQCHSSKVGRMRFTDCRTISRSTIVHQRRSRALPGPDRMRRWLLNDKGRPRGKDDGRYVLPGRHIQERGNSPDTVFSANG